MDYTHDVKVCDDIIANDLEFSILVENVGIEKAVYIYKNERDTVQKLLLSFLENN